MGRLQSRNSIGAKAIRQGQTIPAVIISDGGSPNAYDLVRCLGMEGIPSCVMSSKANDIAFFSRFCVERCILPPFVPSQYPGILEVLRMYGGRFSEKPVLFYPSDPELRFVWALRNELSQGYRFLLPPDRIFEQLLNKVSFIEFARAHGLSVPPSIVCRDGRDVGACIEQVGFPCIVKPAHSDDWVWETMELEEEFGPYKSALRRIGSAAELRDFCQLLPQRPNGFIVQRYIDGRDEAIHSFHGYFDEHGDCLGYFLGQKLRTYPIHTGGSTYVKTLYNDALVRLSVEALKKIGFYGIVKIDFKFDEHTGEFCLLEINPRYNLWQVLGAHAGINLVSIAYFHQRGEKIPHQQGYANDYRLLYMKQDLRSLVTGYLKTKEWGISSYLRSLQARKCYRVWNFGDPLPFLISLFGFWKRNLVRVVRKLSRMVHYLLNAFTLERGGIVKPSGIEEQEMSVTETRVGLSVEDGEDHAGAGIW